MNQWGALAYVLMLTPWGGYPGQGIYEVQSGIGAVNNILMFDRLSDQDDLKLSWPMHALKRCGLNVGGHAWPGNKRKMIGCVFPFTE